MRIAGVVFFNVSVGLGAFGGAILLALLKAGDELEAAAVAADVAALRAAGTRWSQIALLFPGNAVNQVSQLRQAT